MQFIKNELQYVVYNEVLYKKYHRIFMVITFHVAD